MTYESRSPSSVRHQDFGRTIESDISTDSGSRGIIRKVVASVAALGLAGTVLFIAKASSAGGESKATNQAIEKIIKPEMQKIARTAISLESAPPATAVTVFSNKNGIATLVGNNSANQGLNSINVVMRDKPGTKTPDPNQVLITDITTGTNNTNKGPSNTFEQVFIAPGLSQSLVDNNNGMTQLWGEPNPNYWAAYSDSNNAKNGDVTAFVEYDTVSSADYALDVNLNPVGPVQTARSVVGDAQDNLAILVDTFKQK